jgi:hypothetical protein
MVNDQQLTEDQAKRYALAAARIAGLNDIEATKTINSAFTMVIS